MPARLTVDAVLRGIAGEAERALGSPEARDDAAARIAWLADGLRVRLTQEGLAQARPGVETWGSLGRLVWTARNAEARERRSVADRLFGHAALLADAVFVLRLLPRSVPGLDARVRRDAAVLAGALEDEAQRLRGLGLDAMEGMRPRGGSGGVRATSDLAWR